MKYLNLQQNAFSFSQRKLEAIFISKLAVGIQLAAILLLWIFA